MIAINDTTAFSGLDIVEAQSTIVIPNLFELGLIGSSVFTNAAITTAFKTLLSDISTAILLPNFLETVSKNVKSNASKMFNDIGFSKNANGTISFTAASNALDIGTIQIINKLHDINNFNAIATNAFLPGLRNWAKRANDIRAMAGSGLKKIHYITVTKLDVNSIVQDINSMDKSVFINNTKVNERFAVISPTPAMPRVKIKNNSNVSLKVRLKIKFKKTANSNGTGQINRVFLDYFPNQNSPNHNTETIGTTQIYTKIIASQASWEIDYEGKIRGGDATIEYIENSLAWSDATIYKFTFNIRARNPTRQNVLDYLNEVRVGGTYLSRYWFILKLIRHESGTHGGNEFLHFNLAVNNEYVHNNNIMGLPCFGAPRGFGLGQIDNYGAGQISNNTVASLGLTQQLAEIQAGAIKEYQTITDNQGRFFDYQRYQVSTDDAVWDWKKNIDMIILVLGEKINAIDDDIEEMRNNIISWNTANPNNKVDVPIPINYNTIQYKWFSTDINEFINFNNLFQEGISPTIPALGNRILKSFYDAMLIKSYNGNSGGGTFMEMTTVGGKPKLIFNEFNSEPFNYVERISNTID